MPARGIPIIQHIGVRYCNMIPYAGTTRKNGTWVNLRISTCAYKANGYNIRSRLSLFGLHVNLLSVSEMESICRRKITLNKKLRGRENPYSYTIYNIQDWKIISLHRQCWRHLSWSKSSWRPNIIKKKKNPSTFRNYL